MDIHPLSMDNFHLIKEKPSLCTNPFLVITHISELLLMCWLLIKGANIEKMNLSNQPTGVH
jgi:hypothetical protein